MENYNDLIEFGSKNDDNKNNNQVFPIKLMEFSFALK